MGFGFIAAGLFFLFNPNISVVDVLPDWIGYLLIYRGLYQMSFLSPKLQETRGSLWKLALITALRMLSILLLPNTSDTFALVLAFTFGVLEALFFLPMVAGLFEGWYGLGMRLNVSSVYDTRTVHLKGDNGESTTKTVENAERLKIYTIVFFLIKTVASILPELTSLQSGDSDAMYSALSVELTRFEPIFYIFCALITLIFGIVWLVSFRKYVRTMKKDTVLCDGIAAHFRTAVTANPALLAVLRMKKVHVMLICASVCTWIFLVDGVDIILNAFAAVFLIIALLLMRRDAENPLLVAGSIAACAATALLSVVNLFLQIPYFEEYEAMAARYITGASVAYKAVRFWGSVEGVMALIMFALTLIVYCFVLKKHVAYIPITGNTSQYSADARRREILHEVYSRVIVTGAVGLVYLILSASYFTAAMYLAEIYIVNAIVCLFWIGMTVHLTTTAYENIYERLEQNF